MVVVVVVVSNTRGTGVLKTGVLKKVAGQVREAFKNSEPTILWPLFQVLFGTCSESAYR